MLDKLLFWVRMSTVITIYQPNSKIQDNIIILKVLVRCTNWEITQVLDLQIYLNQLQKHFPMLDSDSPHLIPKISLNKFLKLSVSTITYANISIFLLKVAIAICYFAWEEIILDRPMWNWLRKWDRFLGWPFPQIWLLVSADRPSSNSKTYLFYSNSDHFPHEIDEIRNGISLCLLHAWKNPRP